MLTAPDDSAVRIGGRIRQLRHARGLTLVQLAETSELSHPFLSQLERGLARPSIGSLEKIARALGSSQLELLAAEDAPTGVDQSPTESGRTAEVSRGTNGPGDAQMLMHGRLRVHPIDGAEYRLFVVKEHPARL